MTKPQTTSHATAEMQLRLLVEQAPIGIAITRELELLYANPSLLRLLGYGQLDDIAGLSVLAHVADNRRDLVAGFVARRANGEDAPSRYETALLHRLGHEIPAHIAVATIDLEDGPANTVFVTDLTERVKAQRQIERQLATLSALYESAQLQSYSLSVQEIADTIVRTCVERFEASFAWLGHAEVDGLVRVVGSFPPAHGYLGRMEIRWDNTPEGQGPTGGAIRTGAPVIGDNPGADPEIAPWRAAAEAAGFEASGAFPLVCRDSTFGALSVYSDHPGFFTPERANLFETYALEAAASLENARLYAEMQRNTEELELRVRERTAELEAANKELEAFSYSISHDLRAPLRAVTGFSKALDEDCAGEISEAAHRYIALIRSASAEMAAMIEDLLQFSRLGRQSLDVEPVDMAEMARGILDSIIEHEDARDFDIRLNGLPQAMADRGLVRHVWMNYLTNAVKFTRTRSRAIIEIGSVDAGGRAAYYVKDNGVGFDMRQASRLFGVFQRLHRVDEFEGTGAGLAIVQRIVARHGGQVWAHGVVDEGATFYFTLGKQAEDGK